MKIKLLISVAMIGILLTASACAAVNANTITEQTTIEVTIEELMQQEHIEKQVTIDENAILKVNLGSNPSTGFSWGEQAQIGDQEILEQTGQDYIAPDNNIPGAAGNHEWTFKAIAQGTTTVFMEYSRPWEGGEKGAWTFELTVEVK
jgi:inhibitor of cysteine peptidase